MAQQTTFPLSLIVNVSVNIAPVAPAPPTFNQGLVIGTSAVIPSVGSNARVRQYTSLAAMVTDGFSTSSPEYIAAQIYFSQSPAPEFINIGRQDLTAIQTANPHSGNAGTGYAVGDIVSVTQSGASGGELKVLAVTSGAVTSLGLVAGIQGSGYAVATALATTAVTGVGTGLEVDITVIGETAVQALTACRVASPVWYMAGICGAADADHLACAAFAQSASPVMVYVGNTSTVGVANATANNIALELQAQSYNRTFLQYATTQGGLYPNQIYFFAAIMGRAMGLNTGLANSYFTLDFKTMVGMVTEPLTQTQLTNLQTANCNVYLSYANSYTFEGQGTTPNGQFFDEVLFLDMLASQIQFNVTNVFASSNSVPQSDGGQASVLTGAQIAAQSLRTIGFIAQSGTWTGVTILKLENGDPLPNGFLAQSPAFNTQSPSDRAARKMMPIYLSIVEAGSGQSVTVGVYVQR